MKRHPSARGFTLIELMIAVTVIGILAALAYPSYKDYIIKNRRAGIQAYMVQVAAKQEQYVLDARAYAEATGTTDPHPLGLMQPTTLTSYYTVAITPNALPPLGFTITATAIGAQSIDGNLSLDNTGVKTPAGKW